MDVGKRMDIPIVAAAPQIQYASLLSEECDLAATSICSQIAECRQA